MPDCGDLLRKIKISSKLSGAEARRLSHDIKSAVFGFELVIQEYRNSETMAGDPRGPEKVRQLEKHHDVLRVLSDWITQSVRPDGSEKT